MKRFFITVFLLTAWPQAFAGDAHSLFDEVLNDHVDDGQVNYDGIKNDPRFFEYIEGLKEIDADAIHNKDEKLALWINAYNALAIQGILEGRSPASLFGRAKYFLTSKNRLAGMDITLDALEKQIIIPMGEPRIHFAIVCASYSCPKLRAEAYVASRLDAQLDENTRDFINDPVKNAFDKNSHTARVSKIFDWFESDFTDHSGSIGQYLARFIEDEELVSGLMENKYKIRFLKYNWSLNGSFSK